MRWGGYSGQYYYDQRGKTIYLSNVGTKAARGNALEEQDADGHSTGSFQLGRALARQLMGTWRSPDGRRQLPVRLLERYEDAVQFQVEHWNLTRYLAPDSLRGPVGDSALFRGEYLRISLPQNPAAARRIARAMAPPFAAPRMVFYLDTLLRNRQLDQPAYSFIGQKYVVYNSNNLFSVVQFDSFSAEPESSYGSHEWTQGYTFDLRTGKQLNLADLLVAGYQPKLRQLILQQLRKFWKSYYTYDGVGRNGKLPASGFVVTGTGLQFTYDDRDEESLASPGPYHADREIKITISYEALLPLIKVAGPLASVLRERNLLPKK
ncbi:MAG: hypothetical protein EOO62_19345 [Hymenobacter sp.]|nr:MAG: hypothetical protein EOO62_19345 [Hymenobacter sp.]